MSMGLGRRIVGMVVAVFVASFAISGCGSGGSSAKTTAPTGVSAVSAGAGQVTVSWQPVSGATSYTIYWSTTSGVTPATGTKIANASSPYTHTGLDANTAYYYIVTAVNGAGESAPSNQVAVTGSATPAVPVGLAAIGGAGQTTMAWGGVSGATSYNLYWSTQSGVTTATGTKIANVGSPYTHTGLSANTTYYYIVTAVNGAGEGVASDQASATTATVAGNPPAAPTGVAVTSGTNQTTVSWQPVSGAASYNIYWSNDPGHVMASMSAKITGVTSPYRHTGLDADTEYAYVVTALNASGESIESAPIVSARTPAIDGVALYAANCSGCHGSLAGSSKRGVTAAQIQAAIGSIGAMGSLGSLIASQVQAIADVLGF